MTLKPRLYSLLLLLNLALPCCLHAQPEAASRNRITVDASAPMVPPETGYLHLGGVSSNGHSLQVNSRYFVLDGKPWLPVMGELHYTRVPESSWEDEILKMKAGGVNIVATYVFWIHHEEIEGTFDWTGRRDLRHFVELCAKHGMYVWLRPGPWAHGEVRNGGFPDWLAKLPDTRTNDAAYVGYVQRFFNQIGVQLQGLMFQDGGPVIGTQLENEYGVHGPGRGAEHILKLKQLAIAAGIDPPLFSVTGWPSLDFPAREVLPVSGGYPDGFWYGSQTNLPPSMNYLFNFNRELGDMGATVPSEDSTGKIDLRHYPFSAAEEAGGMASAYHRRPVLSADDIAALTLTGIGSGINLYGYYMFHGGANPLGLRTTLQESQATEYPNDLPVSNYDFQAPLGEFGQQREVFGKIRRMHLFLNAYGSELALMPAFASANRSKDPADATAPRVAVRSDGASGFLFVNNYVRQMDMPALSGFQVAVKLAGGDLFLPAKPVSIPANSYFAWPINLAVGKATLRYSTAQLLTQLDTPNGRMLIFFAMPGIAPEFCLDGTNVRNVLAPGASIARRGGTVTVTGLRPGMNTTVQITDTAGTKVTLLLLTEVEAEQTAFLSIGNQDHLAMTSSSLFFDGKQIHLRSTSSPVQQLALLPGLNLAGQQGKQDGLWTTFKLSQPEQHLKLDMTQTQTATARPAMDMGPYVDWRKTTVPTVPPDSAFANASVWSLKWTRPEVKGISQVLLRIRYAGDIGRLYANSTLLDDNFFNGLPWEIGLQDLSAAKASSPLTLKLLPMPAIAPIYLDPVARKLIGEGAATPKLIDATLIPEYEAVLTPR